MAEDPKTFIIENKEPANNTGEDVDLPKWEVDKILAENPRPTVRSDCEDGPRPCPWIKCRHHIYNTNGEGYSQQIPLEKLAETCSLDAADKGPLTLEEVANLLGLTRERIRQIESRGLYKMRLKLSKIVGNRNE